jgi:hypothetical protein
MHFLVIFEKKFDEKHRLNWFDMTQILIFKNLR